MLATLQLMFDLDRDLSRLAVYANSLSDEDGARGASARDEAVRRGAGDAPCLRSWVRPEILTRSRRRRWTKFLADEPKLGPYRVYLQETLCRKAHTLGAAEERVASRASLERAGGEVHGVLSNADCHIRTVKLSTGESVRLDPAAYPLQRQDRNRADRDKVFAAFFGAQALRAHGWARRWPPP